MTLTQALLVSAAVSAQSCLKSALCMQMVSVSSGDSFITLYPSNTLKISCGVDHAVEAPIIGRQWFSWAPFHDDHYRWIIAPARTFYKSMKVRSLLPHS